MRATAYAKAMTFPAVLLFALFGREAFGTSPEWATLSQAVQSNKDLSLAYRAIQASGAQADVLSGHTGSVTFLAPDDLSCAGVKELHVDEINAAWATRFVLSHTFHGHISAIDARRSYGHSLALSVESDDGQVRTVLDEGSIPVTDLLGSERRISLTHGTIVVDESIHVRSNLLVGTKTGNLGVVDDCNAR